MSNCGHHTRTMVGFSDVQVTVALTDFKFEHLDIKSQTHWCSIDSLPCSKDDRPSRRSNHGGR